MTRTKVLVYHCREWAFKKLSCVWNALSSGGLVGVDNGASVRHVGNGARTLNACHYNSSVGIPPCPESNQVLKRWK